MRIYEGSPRQDYEEVLRSIGAFLDQRGMHDVLLVEAPDGFILQGVAMESEASARSESAGYQVKETLTFLDDDIARFMEEAVARRTVTTAVSDWTNAGYYEKSFRVSASGSTSRSPATSSSSSRRARTWSAFTRSGRRAPTTCSRSSRRTTSRR